LNNLLFLKLGGSAITDKTHESTARPEVIRRIAREIKGALNAQPGQKILIGHGSGSFGHFAAKKSGFGQRGNWSAYAATGAVASQLTRIVTDIFIDEGVPVVAMQPSASALCRDGRLIQLATTPVELALAHGLVPLVHGDVAFDETRDMTIASTEMIFAYLAERLEPTRIILAGIVDGVFTGDPLKYSDAVLIREITPRNFPQIESQLRGSHGVDVTGGMVDKVRKMVALVEVQPKVRVQIISAMREGVLARALADASTDPSDGTIIHA
jgi:isopentenyl phosphate kinase